MSKHVHIRLNYVHICLYLEIYKHVCTMYIHCMYMFIPFLKMYVHVHTFSEKYVHVRPVYVIGMYYSIVHRLYVHVWDMYVHVFARWVGFQMGRGLKHEPQVNTSPLTAAAACVGGVGCIGSCGGGLAFGNWPAGSQHQPPKLLHSRRQPAWNTSASGPEKSDHAQKRFCPLADRPNQRHPKNRISFQWNCPMKNFN